MQKIHKEITINRDVSTVYDYMLDKNTYSQWTKAFCPDSRYEGTFKVGEEIKFLGTNDGVEGGMVAKVVNMVPNEILDFVHFGIIKNGVVDVDSDEVKKFSGAHETYIFKDNGDGTTTLEIDQDSSEDWHDMINGLWDKALLDLKSQIEAL